MTTLEGVVGVNNSEFDGAISIGEDAEAKADNAAQIGTGINTEEGTFKFRNYKLLDADGQIPVARLSNPIPNFSLSNEFKQITINGADGATVLSEGTHEFIVRIYNDSSLSSLMQSNFIHVNITVHDKFFNGDLCISHFLLSENNVCYRLSIDPDYKVYVLKYSTETGGYTDITVSATVWHRQISD